MREAEKTTRNRENSVMTIMQKAALAAVAISASIFAGPPTLAEPTHHEPAMQLAQAQGQSPSEAESAAPGDQYPAMQPGRGGPGMMGGMMGGGMKGGMGPMGMCPMMMGGMGHGMMGGMGPMGMCPMMMGRGEKDLSADQVRDILEGHIAWSGNKRLKVGTVEQKDEKSYLADIVTVDDSLVQRLEVDRASGAMRPVE